jgi:glycosyltransferase involved in cell wall biosynthesis
MAGPGIRYYELARVLAQEFEVILAAPNEIPAEMGGARLTLTTYDRGDWNSLAELIAGARAALVNTVTPGDFPQIVTTHTPLMVDGYDPILAEWMAMLASNPAEAKAHWAAQMVWLARQYLAGDFFVCASERQRDWWLGLLEAHGRVNPWTVGEDHSLRRLVDVVPFGLPSTPPPPHPPRVRGVIPGIGADDQIVLWGGGLWLWLDPLTAVRAVAALEAELPRLRLLFPGTAHPNPTMAGIPSHLAATQALAEELGQRDRRVFFGDWVDYADWPGVLQECDAALSLHFEDTLETRWAFRTRVLDYIWAGLPIVATGGDATSEIIARWELGELVPGGDVTAAAAALRQVLTRPRAEYAAGFSAARQALTWERAAAPLLRFCREPRRAPDKLARPEGVGTPYYQAELASAQAAYQAEIDDLRAAQQTEIDGLRAAQQTEIDGLRAAQQAEIDALRAAQQTEIDALRAAQQAEIDALRAAQQALYAELEAFRSRKIVRLTDAAHRLLRPGK